MMGQFWCWLRRRHDDFRLGEFNVCRCCGRYYRRLTDADVIREALRLLYEQLERRSERMEGV